MDRGFENVGDMPGTVVAQQQHPGVERTWNHRRQQSGARHLLQAEGCKALKRGGCGKRALAADHDRLGRIEPLEDDRRLAAGTHQMWLDDLQHEGSRGGGIERVPAAFQHRHGHRACDPVGGRDRAEGAAQFGAGCKDRRH